MADTEVVVGKVVTTHGHVYLRLADGRHTHLFPGQVLHEGDVLVTADGASVRVSLPDGHTYLIGQDQNLALTPDSIQAVAQKNEAPAPAPEQKQFAESDQDNLHDFVRIQEIPDEFTTSWGGHHAATFRHHETLTDGSRHLVRNAEWADAPESGIGSDIGGDSSGGGNSGGSNGSNNGSNNSGNGNSGSSGGGSGNTGGNSGNGSGSTPTNPTDNPNGPIPSGPIVVIPGSHITIDPIRTITQSDVAGAVQIAITGTVTRNIPIGNVVTIVIDGHVYTGTVQAGGTYSIAVPASILANAAIDNVHASVHIGGPNSTIVSADHGYSVDLSSTPPTTGTVHVDPLPIINGADATGTTPIQITGSTNLPAGSTVTVTVDGHTYTGTVQTGGTFSVGVPGSVLAGAANDTVTVTLSGTDSSGHNIGASASLPYTVDVTPPVVAITIDPIPPITGGEASSSAPIPVTGTVSGEVPPGTVVTVTVGGHSYTGTVSGNGTYSVDVPGNVLGGTSTSTIHASVSVSDAAGNVGSATAGQVVSVVTNAEYGITIDPIDVVNSAEAASTAPIYVTGTVKGDHPAGDLVTLTIDGHTYTGVVQANGTYSIGVPGNVLAGANDHSVHVVSVSVSDDGNHAISASANQSYEVELAAPPISVTLDPLPPVTEAQATSTDPVSVTGTVSANVPLGTVVTATVNGHTYTGTVQAGDVFSIDIPGNVLGATSSGSIHVSLSSQDAAGNTASTAADLNYVVDPTPPTVTIALDPIPTVNNATGTSSAPVAITGHVSSNVPAGTLVSITVDGHTYTGAVQAGGGFSVGVPGNVLAVAAVDTVHASVSFANAVGAVGSASADLAYTVNLGPGTVVVTVDPVPVINGATAGSTAPVFITGQTSSNVPIGTTVTLVVDGHSYTGTVQSGGTYSISVPGSVLGHAAVDSLHVSLSFTDTAGNTASASATQSYSVELAAEAIAIAIDELHPITHAEAASSAPVVVTGTVSDNVPAGTVVTLTVDGHTYLGSVRADGTYSIGVPGNVLAGATVDNIHVSLSTTDAAGNTATASADLPYTFATTTVLIDLTVEPIPTINGAQAASSNPINITGHVSSNVAVAGSTVTLTVDGHNYTGTVHADGSYSIGVPGNILAAAGDTSITVGVTVTDPYGNTATSSVSEAYSVELNAPPIGIALDPVDVINGAEAASANPIAITGTVTSNVPAGTVVTLTVDGHTYTGTVQAGGVFSIGVPGDLLGHATQDSIHVAISTTTAAGNVATASADQTYVVELTAPAIGIGIDPIDVINGAEAASSAPIPVTGTVSSNVPAGTTVTLTVDGHSYTGAVLANHTYSIGIPGNVLGAAGTDNVHASVSVTSAAGNTASASADQAYVVELTAPPIGIGIDPIDAITPAEAASANPIPITGTVSSNVPVGETVTLTVDGHSYTGAVHADHTYSIGIPGNVLAGAQTDNVHASISTTNAAGNTATASADQSYTVYNNLLVIDIEIDPLITINAAVAASGNNVNVTGTVSSNVPAGDVVTLIVGGHTYTGTVTAGGTFSIGIPGSVLAGAASDTIAASVSVTDPLGHVVTATASLAYNVELVAPPVSITIAPVATINGLDAISPVPIAVTGTVSANVPLGQTVTLTVDGHTYTGSVGIGGTYSIGVPGSVLAGASHDSITASIAVTDAAGNTANASVTAAYTVELFAPPISIGINPIVTINGAIGTSTNPVAVTGTVSANVPVGETVTLTVGSHTYTGTVLVGGVFSIGVPGNILAGSASVHASISATDAAGNTANAGITVTYAVELTAPPVSLTIDPLVTINGALGGSASPVAVTGSVSANVPVGTAVTAIVDGHSYSGTVQASGTFSVGVPGNVLAAAASDVVTVSLSTTDAAGNTASASQSLAYAVQLVAPPISISILPIATVNAAMAASAGLVAVSGAVSINVPAGDVVTLSVGGHTYTGTVQANGTYSIGVPGNILATATSDNIHVSVSATDAAGNVASASADLAYVVELAAPPIGIGINAVATINAAQAASSTPIPITGTVSANVHVGDTVTLTVDSHVYTGTVLAGGIYSIGIPGNILAGASVDNIHAAVSATDAAGNIASASADLTYSVNTAAPIVTIGINPIITINGAIAASASPVAITGSVSANVPVGDIVTLTVAGHTYTGAVQAGGVFSIGVPGNILGSASSDEISAKVSVTDGVGNVGTGSVTQAYTVELVAPPITVGINPLAVVNGVIGTSANPVAVTGSVSANVPAGSLVTLTVDGHAYTGTVSAGATYSIGIPGTVLANAGVDSIRADISTTDAAGNTASASANLSYGVDLLAPVVSISVNPIAIVNGLLGGSSAPIAVTGSVSGEVHAGDTVSLTVAGHVYTGAVSAGNTYSIGIPGNVLAGASVDNISAGITVTDSAGNVGSASANLAYNVELVAPAISIGINPIVTINGAMAASSLPIPISGVVSANVPIGTGVSLSVAGHVYTGSVQAGGIYSIGVPGNILAGATTDNVQVSVSTTDAAGNSASATANLGYTVELVAPPISVSINPIGVLSSLLTGNYAITGSVSANVPVGTPLSVNVGGNTYTGAVQSGGTYSVAIPALVLILSLLDIVQVSVSYNDAAGNLASATASQGYSINLLAMPPTHTTAPEHFMMHVGHMNAPHIVQATAAKPAVHIGHQAGHSLGDLFGADHLPFTLPAAASASEAHTLVPMRPAAAALHMADLLVDHDVHSLHVSAHIAVHGHTAPAHSLPALPTHDQPHSLPALPHPDLSHVMPAPHDAALQHALWHKGVAME